LNTDAEIIIADEVIVAAKRVASRDICIDLACTIGPPHYSRAETVGPIWLTSSRASIRIRSTPNSWQLPTLDPVEVGIKGDFVT